MSIESLCTGDIVVKQTQSISVGISGGVSETYTDGSSYDCNVQVEQRGDPDGAVDVKMYGARGQAVRYKVYFSEDVDLNPSNRLKWTVKSGTAVATPKLLRVLSYYDEGRPGEDLLWIADCEWIDVRVENT